MKVEIDTAALADAVAWTSRVIDARPSNPILAGVKLEAIDGTLQFSAFNYEISARHHIEAGVDEVGSALVLGKLLADITKSLRSEKTYLTTDGSTLTITSGKSKFTLQLMPDAEYPDLPVVPPMLGQVDAQTFVQAVNRLPRRKPSGTDRRAHAVPGRQSHHDLHRPLPFGSCRVHLDPARRQCGHHHPSAWLFAQRRGSFSGRTPEHPP